MMTTAANASQSDAWNGDNGRRWVARYARDADAQTAASGVSSGARDMGRWLAMLSDDGAWLEDDALADQADDALLLLAFAITAFGLVIAGFAIAYQRAAPLDLNSAEPAR